MPRTSERIKVETLRGYVLFLIFVQRFVSTIFLYFLSPVIVRHLQETDVLYNVVTSITSFTSLMKALSGKSHTETLMQHMKDQNVTATVAVDEENHIRHLSWLTKVRGFHPLPSKSWLLTALTRRIPTASHSGMSLGLHVLTNLLL